jgi:2-desacetyl-2-hydroxyethyl bacteriochlorophyllide A dehydrogenase
VTRPERDLLYFVAPHRVEVRRAEMPAAGAGEALVQTVVSAISPGTELLFYRGEAPAGMAVDATLPALGGALTYPLRYGYACVGRVVQAGPGVGNEWLGRTVFAFQPHASAFAAPVTDLLPVPAGVAPEAAAFLPNMETAVNFVHDGRPLLGERVGVWGAGVVGLLAAALLARFPLGDLAVVERIPARRERASALGATRALDPADPAADLRDLDLAFELSGNPAALNAAIAALGFGGRLVVGSWYGSKAATLDLGGPFHRNRITLVSSQVSTVSPLLAGRWDKARRFAAAWEMLRRVDVAALVTHRFPLARAADAYALLDEHPEACGQVVFEYGSEQ